MRAGHDRMVVLCESVADEYDRARPSYPDGIYDALGPLNSLRVLDIGAGTGIATRQLLDRGADVIAIDPGRNVLTRATGRTVGLPVVVADGAALPVKDFGAAASARRRARPRVSRGPPRSEPHDDAACWLLRASQAATRWVSS